jgi:hypothetical protein
MPSLPFPTGTGSAIRSVFAPIVTPGPVKFDGQLLPEHLKGKDVVIFVEERGPGIRHLKRLFFDCSDPPA